MVNRRLSAKPATLSNCRPLDYSRGSYLNTPPPEHYEIVRNQLLHTTQIAYNTRILAQAFGEAMSSVARAVEVLRFVIGHVEDHGYQPSMSEIAAHFGVHARVNHGVIRTLER